LPVGLLCVIITIPLEVAIKSAFTLEARMQEPNPDTASQGAIPRC